MYKDQKVLNEIAENANKIPLECKEQVLALIKAMAFTKRVMSEKKSKNNEKCAVDKKAG